ncbi:MAG: hypothetical protein ACRC41_04925 [Sarcina sp.]
MKINPKRSLVNLNYLDIQGSVLDVSINNNIIYNLLNKNNENFNQEIDKNNMNYEVATIFFSLGLLTVEERKQVINDLYAKLRTNSYIYLWERVKRKKEIVYDKIIVKLPDNSEDEFVYMNLNPFSDFNISDCMKIVSSKFYIEEKMVWDGIIYIKAIKK